MRHTKEALHWPDACIYCMPTVYSQWLKKVDSYTYSHIQIDTQNAHWAKRFANEPNSLFEKLCIYQRGLSRSWPALVSSSLSLLALSFFYSSPGIFFNKIWSKRILEANIHSFVWRLVKEKKDAGCVYVWVIKYVYTLALWWQLMQS